MSSILSRGVDGYPENVNPIEKRGQEPAFLNLLVETPIGCRNDPSIHIKEFFTTNTKE